MARKIYLGKKSSQGKINHMFFLDFSFNLKISIWIIFFYQKCLKLRKRGQAYMLIDILCLCEFNRYSEAGTNTLTTP